MALYAGFPAGLNAVSAARDVLCRSDPRAALEHFLLI
jgi:hypothetical protein